MCHPLIGSWDPPQNHLSIGPTMHPALLDLILLVSLLLVSSNLQFHRYYYVNETEPSVKLFWDSSRPRSARCQWNWAFDETFMGLIVANIFLMSPIYAISPATGLPLVLGLILFILPHHQSPSHDDNPVCIFSLRHSDNRLISAITIDLSSTCSLFSLFPPIGHKIRMPWDACARGPPGHELPLLAKIP